MNLKSTAVNGLKGAAKMLEQDMEALPEEAFAKAFGPATRTVADVIYEVNLVNDHVGMVIRGEEPFDWPDGWITAPEGFRSKSAVMDGFKKSSDSIIATVEALSEDAMKTVVQTEHGERTRFARCQFMTLHMWYHSGQLNFIQTLLGDNDWHWS
jgi:hypothetical protein